METLAKAVAEAVIGGDPAQAAVDRVESMVQEVMEEIVPEEPVDRLDDFLTVGTERVRKHKHNARNAGTVPQLPTFFSAFIRSTMRCAGVRGLMNRKLPASPLWG